MPASSRMQFNSLQLAAQLGELFRQLRTPAQRAALFSSTGSVLDNSPRVRSLARHTQSMSTHNQRISSPRSVTSYCLESWQVRTATRYAMSRFSLQVLSSCRAGCCIVLGSRIDYPILSEFFGIQLAPLFSCERRIFHSIAEICSLARHAHALPVSEQFC